MLIKTIRLGKDAELATTSNGKSLMRIVGVYDVGFGDNKKSQWVECTMWGERIHKVVDYFKKGTQITAYIDDVAVETYEGKNGFGAKLRGNLVSFDFAGGKAESSGQAPSQPQQAPQQAQQAPQAKPQAAPDFGGFDDTDIPFSNYQLKTL